MYTTTELMSLGMNCLVERFGVVDAERFITAVIRESSDYTKFRKTLFEGKTLEQIVDNAAEFDQEHPFSNSQ